MQPTMVDNTVTIDGQSYELASFESRLNAHILDIGMKLGLLVALYAARIALIDNQNAFMADMFGRTVIAYLLIAFIYEPVCTALFGQTLGKRLTGIRVVSRASLKPDVIDSFTRWGIKLFIGGLSAGRAIIIGDASNRRDDWVWRPAHDSSTGTWVVVDQAIEIEIEDSSPTSFEYHQSA